MTSHLTPFKTTAAAALGTGVLVAGGVAAAATGTLPGAAQDMASQMLSHVGVSVPGADEHSGGHAETRGSSGDHTPSASGAEGATGSAAADAGKGQGKGQMVSELAKSDDTTGIEKGAAVSKAASGGHSRAGDDHPGDTSERPAAGGDSGGQAQVDTPNSGGADRPDTAGGAAGGEHADGQAPVETPNGGGTGTADGASDGHSSTGTGTAANANDGQSAAGSQNAAGHRP